MHIMDNTKKIITIIGLGFELLSIGGFLFTIWFLNNIESIPGMSVEFSNMSPEDLEAMKELFSFLVSILYIVLPVVVVIIFINIFLFSKLLAGKYTEEQAKKVYLYQAIWGGINLLSNQITGILYLISGIGGYNGQKEETDIRDGI